MASIIGLGRACELAADNLNDEAIYLSSLRDRLERSILESCPDASVNGDQDNRLPNTANISFEYIEGEAILLRLDEHGICASSGSACTSGSLQPSHVLRAMGTSFNAIHGSIRFTLSRYNSEADIDTVARVLPSIVKELRSFSPYGR